jgi:copper chaperone NosL
MKTRRELLALCLLGGGAPLLAAACPGDGTPAQFLPRAPPDPEPRVRELEKYRLCPYCGMDRSEHHRIRMLVRYADDLCDAVCSIHCLALSLALNLDREPAEILGPDAGSPLAPRPLVDVDTLHYLIGSALPHPMTRRSKHGFATAEARLAAQALHGGEFGDFEAALEATYLDLFQDVRQVRRARQERLRRRREKP